ncbi:conserved unknown protein [Ectocarpus siliculosus]|uniref:Myotubularin phosphatase domain-containing protein n=1 Tax=Ectocarpus siliculosus TaxID=2880 RepID=D8LQ50_ECTSI|nr:conserved unknown protein [Ectocarpus siliculosus]|eukprot:CBN77430.1 conserved unknown protein [Ectocarpus siliculosus]
MLLQQFSLQLPQLELLMTAGGGAVGDEEQHNAETPPVSTRPKPSLLDGETVTNVVKPIGYVLARKRSGGGEFHGALHITNFRLILQRTGAGKDAFGRDDPSLQWVSFPMGCIKDVTQADDDRLAITITAKDLRSCRMRFLSNNALFVSTLTQGVIKPKSLDSPARTGPVNAASGAMHTEGSLAGTPDEPPRWRLFYNRSYTLVPSYPLHFVVPAVMSDANVRAAAAYRSKGRLPVVTWMDPKTRAVLSRSAQPLAGLGGKTCAEDARLLSLFGNKGKPEETTLRAAPAPAPAPATATAPATTDTPSTPTAPIRSSNTSSTSRRRARASTSLPPGLRGNRRSTIGGGGGARAGEATPRLKAADGGNGSSSKGAGKQGGERGTEPAANAANAAAGKTEEPRAESGESFLDALSSWTPPWSTTKVAVQHTQPGHQSHASRHHEGLTPPKKEPGAPPDLPSLDRGGGGGGGQRQVETKQPRGENEERRRAEARSSERVGPEESAFHGSCASPAGTAAGGKGSETPGSGKAPRLCLLDARTAVAALGNKLVGKGIETGAGYGNSTQLVFSGIGNVHAVKDAFEELRDSLDPVKVESKMDRWKEDSAKMVAKKMSRSLGFARMMDLKYALGDQLGGDELEETPPYTLWPRLLRQILGASLLAARLLRLDGCSVLVHCSDGWDRTPQICSTVELLLDPHYRTLEGFCSLIEKEWLSYGHKFWARCMGGNNEQEIAEGAAAAAAAAADAAELGDDRSAMRSMKDFVGGQVREYAELSPVFLQFLDLVHNLLAQFPTAFEISEGLLTFVAEHAFSGLYGTFLCDTEQHRSRLKVKQRSISVWTTVLNNREAFVNANYRETPEPLWPSLAPSKSLVR